MAIFFFLPMRPAQRLRHTTYSPAAARKPTRAGDERMNSYKNIAIKAVKLLECPGG